MRPHGSLVSELTSTQVLVNCEFDSAGCGHGGFLHFTELCALHVSHQVLSVVEGVDASRSHGGFIEPEPLTPQSLQICPRFGPFLHVFSDVAGLRSISQFEFQSQDNGVENVLLRGSGSVSAFAVLVEEADHFLRAVTPVVEAIVSLAVFTLARRLLALNPVKALFAGGHVADALDIGGVGHSVPFDLGVHDGSPDVLQEAVRRQVVQAESKFVAETSVHVAFSHVFTAHILADGVEEDLYVHGLDSKEAGGLAEQGWTSAGGLDGGVGAHVVADVCNFESLPFSLLEGVPLDSSSILPLVMA